MAAFELWQVMVSLAVAVVSGIIVGVVVERFRLRNILKIEKIKRLAPYVEAASPLVTRIDEHAEFATKMLHGSGEHEPSAQITKLKSVLIQFVEWYSQFEQRGMRPELESIDRELYDHLTGLFNLARFCSLYGDTYLSQNLDRIREATNGTKSRLNRFWK